MKATTFIAILLTFLMGLLVLVATIIFLLQGRQQMQGLASANATAIARQESTRIQLEANLGSESAALGTSQADLSARDAKYMSLESEVVRLDQELASVTAALAEALEPEPTATPDAETIAPPTIEFLSPQTGDTFLVGTSAEIAFVVYHPAGLSAVQLFVQDQTLETEAVSGKALQRFSTSYTFEPSQFSATQSVIISVVAASAPPLNVVSKPTFVTVTVAIPTPIPTPAPSATPTDTTGATDDFAGTAIVLSPDGASGPESHAGQIADFRAGFNEQFALVDPRRPAPA